MAWCHNPRLSAPMTPLSSAPASRPTPDQKLWLLVAMVIKCDSGERLLSDTLMLGDRPLLWP